MTISHVLLDTHAFIWFIEGNPRLSDVARTAIEDETKVKLFSIASAWEMHIKARLDRLPLSQPVTKLIADQLALNGFILLPIELRHLAPIATLPAHHRDPFDRLLIAQAIVEGIPLVSGDVAFDAYEGLSRLW